MTFLLNPFVFAAAGGGGFSPDSISGLLVWYSPEYEAANYTDGQELTTVTDLSGNSNHATAATTGSAEPLFKATGGPSGGAERFRFENGGYLTLPSGVMGAASAGEYMAMVKGDYAATGGTFAQGFHHFGSAANSNHYDYSGTIYDDFGSDTRKSITPTDTAINTWRRLTQWSAASDWAMYMDGVLQHSTASNTVGWKTVPQIGNSGAPPSNTGTDTFEGDYGAFILYNRKLTSGERSDLATWMAANPSGGMP